MSEVLKGLYEIKDRADKLSYLIQRKGEILHEKKIMPKNNVGVIVKSDMLITPEYDVSSLELGEGEVFVVSNAVNFFDSHSDVSLRGSWNKTVADKGNRIPQLKDHKQLSTGIYAKNLESLVIDMPIKALGYNMAGNTQVLAYKIKPYEQSDLIKYQDGTYNQHSAGLRYKEIWLGINDESDEDSYKLYHSQINNIINREEVEQNGFYFGVVQQEAIENSLVVFGSNPLTPAFTNKSLDAEPPKSTPKNEPTAKRSFYTTLIRS